MAQDKYITEEQFKKFLEELNVVIADIGAEAPKLAWRHYNDAVYDIRTKEIKLNK